MKIRRLILCILAAAWFGSPAARALIEVGNGSDPVTDPGWPEGALAVGNLKTRAGWWEGPPFGGGEWQFLYRGNTVAFTEALAAFAAIRAPELELVVHDEAGESPFLAEPGAAAAAGRYQWSFTVWIPANWNRLYNNPESFFSADQPEFRRPVAPPRLDLFLGGDSAVDFSAVKIPANVHLRDERAVAAGVHVTQGAFVRADIFDMDTGKPISGAKVTVLRLPEGRQNQPSEMVKAAGVETGKNGRADLDAIAPGICRISVTAPGYAPRLLTHEGLAEHSFRAFTVWLAKTAALHGTAVDGAGAPLKGVHIRAASTLAPDGRGYPPPEAIEALSDAAGKFELSGLPAGHTTLDADFAGYYFGDLFTLHPVPPAAEVRLKLVHAAKVRVTVKDKAGQVLTKFDGGKILVSIAPKGGNKVGSWGGSGEVDAQGVMEFSGMPAGEYRISSQPNPAVTGRVYAEEKVVTVTEGADLAVTITYQ